MIPTSRAGPPWITPTITATIPAKIAISAIGSPPNGLGGLSPTVPSCRSPVCNCRSLARTRSARCSRRLDGTARGTASLLRRLRLDLCRATGPSG